MLIVCRTNHEEITHNSGECPLCYAFQELSKLAQAKAEIVRLKMRVADLEKEP